jgi:hypothetical protein
MALLAATVSPAMNYAAVYEFPLLAFMALENIRNGEYAVVRPSQQLRVALEVDAQGLFQPEVRDEFFIQDGTITQFVARVLGLYGIAGESVAALDADGMRFAVPRFPGDFGPGSIVSGDGRLWLDRGSWFEAQEQYRNAPDMYHDMRVVEVHRKVPPEKQAEFAAKGGEGAVPLWLEPSGEEDLPVLSSYRPRSGHVRDPS